MDKNRIIFYIAGSIAIVLAGAIGLTLYYTLSDDESNDDRDDVIVNCLPHIADPSKSECEEYK